MSAVVYHIPALLPETISGLVTDPSGTYVDVTFGGGGHSRAILSALTPSGRLYSFDQDEDALRNAIDDPRWTFVHSNFRYLTNWLDFHGVLPVEGKPESGITGLLADLGVSFHHFDEAERGFSFRFPGPLDMRMNQSATRTAADIINTYEENDIARVLYLYGEIKENRALAHKIVLARDKSPVRTIDELIAALGFRIPADRDFDPRTKKILTCVFQALRIEVNDELAALREMLLSATEALRPGGRIAILTYHSLEDRIVKNFFRSGNIDGTISKDFYGNIRTPFRLIEKGLSANDEEVARNPRARSAKLRIAEKI